MPNGKLQTITTYQRQPLALISRASPENRLVFSALGGFDDDLRLKQPGAILVVVHLELTVHQEKRDEALSIAIRPYGSPGDEPPAGQDPMRMVSLGRRRAATIHATAWDASPDPDFDLFLGLPRCSAHGLRKAARARLAELGCTEHEIMAITGHRSLKEVSRYTRAARQKVLAASGMAKFAEAQVRDERVPLSRSDQKSGTRRSLSL